MIIEMLLDVSQILHTVSVFSDSFQVALDYLEASFFLHVIFFCWVVGLHFSLRHHVLLDH